MYCYSGRYVQHYRFFLALSSFSRYLFNLLVPIVIWVQAEANQRLTQSDGCLDRAKRQHQGRLLGLIVCFLLVLSPSVWAQTPTNDTVVSEPVTIPLSELPSAQLQHSRSAAPNTVPTSHSLVISSPIQRANQELDPELPPLRTSMPQ